ncbi:MAG: cupin domain-containing protein [Chloroflexota bacterium]
MSTSTEPTVVLIHPTDQTVSKQGIPGFMGVSGKTAGSQGISLKVIVIPPGGKATPHSHVGYETAIYMVAGRVETKYGDRLQESVITEAGDFLFIPAGVPHQPCNLSMTEEARAVVARNDPAEEEHVETFSAS